MEAIDLILRLAAMLGVTATTAAGVAFLLFRFLGTKWIDEAFQKRFADYKHEQDKALQHAKFEIDQSLDRRLHFHNWEYDVLPTAWSKACEAYEHLQGVVNSSPTMPDLTSMSEERCEMFLAESNLSEMQKNDVRAAPDKTRMYSRLEFWNFVKNAEEAYRDARIYIKKNSIFMPDDIRKKFGAFLELIWQTYVQRDMEERFGRDIFGPEDKPTIVDRFRKEAKPSLDELHSMIRSRLLSLDKKDS